MATPAETQSVIRSLIPARIDRLPWSPFHTRMVVALGVAWILDGLEITVASAVADTLTQPETLGLSSAAVGLIATVYLAGEVVGALFFGRLSDKLGRRNLFMITLGVYLVGQRSHRVHAGQQRGLDRLPLRHPVHRRHGHRRGIRRDQLGDRRADPGPIPGPSRHRDQRHLLGRCDPRHARHVHLPQGDRPEPGLAAGLPDRPGPGPGDPAGAPEPTGKPALAGHERPGGRRPSARSPTSSTRWRPPASRCPRSTRARRSSCNPPRRSATWR